MKGFLRILTVVFILLILHSNSRPAPLQAEAGTQEDSVFYYKGRVLDRISRDPVAFAHVINRNRNTATICDTLGYFFLRVNRHDSIRFSAIGYAPFDLEITDSILALDILPDIYLQVIHYSIRGVMINPLGSYRSFRHRLINMELPPTGYEINPNVISGIDQGIDTLDMKLEPSISPVTALYNWLSREGKEMRKYRKVVEQEEFEREIAYKYSPLIVSGITGYSGYKLYSFMDYCNFSHKFLEESDRYRIRDAIMEKQIAFEEKQKPDEPGKE